MIKKISKDGRVLAEFKSLREAARLNSFGRNTLRKAIEQNTLLHGGFWIIVDNSAENRVTIGDESVVDDLHYDFKDNVYSWTSREVRYNIPLAVADKLFFEYSRHGLDKSALDVRMRNNISIREWNSLKHKLQLFKESDIFSPETRKGMTKEEYREVAAKKVRELDAFRKRAVVDEYNKFHLESAKKWRDIANRKTFNHELIVSELSEWFEGRVTKKEVCVNGAPSVGDISAVISDIHYGASTPKEYNNPEFNPDRLHSLRDVFIDEVNEIGAANVDIMLLGDYIETFSGLNHINSWQGISDGMYGAMVVKAVIENFFEPIIQNTANLRRIIAVGGNHDRGTSANKEDVKSQIATLIFYILERLYPEIEFRYDPFCMVYDKGGFRFILKHGNTISANKSEGIINDYGSHEKFNIILTGDKHERAVFNDGYNRRHLRVPPLFTGSYYSSTLGFSAVSGALIINEKNGLPQVRDISFYSLHNSF